ncbi:MAG: DUF72 domain-containing protein [Sedimentisphaerales bacterium]|nr:DUF72 domain-containing protein [Sedimentisphaerales bacterium]
MSRAACDIRIGTSGWYYEHWRELFYPAGLPKSKWFEHYARHFDTVEINNTFYHQPKEQSIIRWHKIAPEAFLYAVKANRFITHIKKLKDASEPLRRFFDGIDLLKHKLGPVLYQLPPSLHIDLDRLRAFIKLLPKRKSAVFEFRHKSWYCEETYKLLEELGAGFCIHDMPGKESPHVVTSDTIYIRFHGTSGRYSGSYPKSALRDWAEWIKDKSKKIKGIYVYFNNDAHGHAIKNAKQLKEMTI